MTNKVEKKRWTGTRRFRAALALLLTAVMTISSLAVTGPAKKAMAAEGDTQAIVPAHAKTRTDNGDGTYKLELSVTGDADTDKVQANHVNVLVMFDVSTSMVNNKAGGSSQKDATRADAAEKAMYDFTQALFKYQNKSDPTNIQMAFAQFSSLANTKTVVDWTSNEADITSKLSSTGKKGSKKLTYVQNTNWEAAQNHMVNVLKDADQDPTFVLFVTDGAPYHYVSDKGKEVNGNNLTSYQEARNAARTVATYKTTGSEKENVTYFGIYAYGSEADYLDDLVYYALNGEERSTVNDKTQTTENYYNAGSTEQLTKAISDIFSFIVQSLGIC